jgi:hypothetical protein
MLTSAGIEREIEPDKNIDENVEEIMEWKT